MSAPPTKHNLPYYFSHQHKQILNDFGSTTENNIKENFENNEDELLNNENNEEGEENTSGFEKGTH